MWRTRGRTCNTLGFWIRENNDQAHLFFYSIKVQSADEDFVQIEVSTVSVQTESGVLPPSSLAPDGHNHRQDTGDTM